MKNTLKRAAIWLALIILCAVMISGCAPKVDPDPATIIRTDDAGTDDTGPEDSGPWVDELTGFAYSYGSFNGGMWEYSITREIDTYLFIAKGSNGVDLDVQAYIDQSVMDEISDVISSNNIDEWNGFDRRDDDILDGYGFNLSAEYSQSSITAAGYEMYPDNYEEGHAALAGCLGNIANTVVPAEPAGVESVLQVNVTFYDSLGEYSMYAAKSDADANEFSEYAQFMLDQSDEFKGSQDLMIGEGDFCNFSIMTDNLDYSVDVSKELNPEAYAQILERSLAMDGKSADYLESEEFATEMYKDEFIYPTAWLYDADGLGRVAVNLAEQTVDVNGTVYTASREVMLAFDEFVFGFPSNSSSVLDYELISDYLEEGQTMEGVFDGFISEGNTWIVGHGHMRDALFLYGGNGNEPEGFTTAAAEFQALIDEVSG